MLATRIALLLGITMAWACGDSSDPFSTGGARPHAAIDGSMQHASDAGVWSESAEDAGRPSTGADADLPNTNIGFGGSGDFGFFRRQLDDGRVPEPGTFDEAGFFAEHHTPLPPPDCGERVCVQALLGVMGNLINGANCTMLQVGLNSPIEADPDNRPPLNLAVAVDVSGSMAGNDRIGYVRSGLEQLIDGLRDDDRIAIVSYSETGQVLFELDELRLQRRAVRDVVQGLEAWGGTNMYAGLELAYQSLLAAYESGRQNRVILLSDGRPSEGIVDTDSILAMSRGFNSEGIGITTVGLGSNLNFPLMQGLSQQGDGNFYYLETAAAVDEVFQEELSYFTMPVVFDLDLRAAAGSHYEFGRAYGAPLWETTEGGGQLVVPSVFVAHRVSHRDVTEEGSGRRGGGSALLLELMPRSDVGPELAEATVVTIDIEYREPGSDRIVTDQVDVKLPMSPATTPERGFFDAEHAAIVQKSFVMLNIFRAFEIASEQFHVEDQMESALDTIRRVIPAVEDYNEEVQDTDIELDLELMYTYAAVVEAAIGAAQPPPPVPSNPWPAD